MKHWVVSEWFTGEYAVTGIHSSFDGARGEVRTIIEDLPVFGAREVALLADLNAKTEVGPQGYLEITVIGNDSRVRITELETL